MDPDHQAQRKVKSEPADAERLRADEVEGSDLEEFLWAAERQVLSIRSESFLPRLVKGGRVWWVILTLSLVLWRWCGVHVMAASATGGADPYVCEVWQVEEGLPGNSATSVVQTPDGYLWVGTYGGLARFDGVRFEVFDADTPGLGSRQITALFVDQQGGLWVAMLPGKLSRYAAGTFTGFDVEDGWSMKPALSFAQSLDGGVMITDAGGRAYQIREGRFSALASDLAGSDQGYQEWVLDTAGVEWALNEEAKLHVWHGGRWEPFVPEGDSSPPIVRRLVARQQGGLWVLDGRRIRLLEHGRWTRDYRVPSNLEPESITCLRDDSSDHLLVGTSHSQLFRIALDGSREIFSTQNDFPHGAVADVCEDHEGNFWVASQGGGLIRLKQAVFQSFDSAQGLPPEAVLSLAEDSSGRLTLGTLGGGMFIMENGRFFGPLAQPGTSMSACALQPGRSGGLWVGTDGEGLLKLGGQKPGQWTVRGGTAQPAITSLYEDRVGMLWIGTETGLSSFDGERFTHYSASDGLSDNHVRVITQDRAGDLWIGTAAGLNRFNGGRFTSFSRRDGLPSDSVQTLLVDADDDLWIGTLDGGLSQFSEGSFVNYSVKDGLPDNSVTVILEDGLGFLWLGTGRGVCRVARSELTAFAQGTRPRFECATYLRNDGLVSIQCSGGNPSGIVTRDGRLWFATMHGVSVAEPQKIPHNSLPPKTVVEEVLIDGEVFFSNRSADATSVKDVSVGGLKIPAGRRHMEIAYTGLSFTSPTRVRFQIQLEGLDTEWQDVGSRRVAYYNGLPPGQYRFRVLAANNDGVWSEEGTALAFTLMPSYWQTWWFRGASLGSVIATILYVFWQRIARRERKRVEEDLRRNEEKFRSLFTSMSEGVALNEVILDRDKTPVDYRIIEVNPAFEKHTGLLATRAKGTLASSLYGGGVAPCLDIFSRVAETGQPQSFETYYSFIQRHFRISVFSAGKGSFATVLEDITERMGAEEALRASNLLNESLIQSIPFGLDIVDEHGRILFLNDKMKNMVGSNPLGAQCWQVYKDDLKQCAHCPLHKPVEIGAIQTVETSDALGGRVFRITHFGMLFHGRKAFLELFEDITESRQSQEKIQLFERQRALEAERSRISRDMHDELGTALTKITLLSERAESEVTSRGDADLQQAGSWMSRITALGRELVVSMDEIVWVVNPRNDQLENLASYLSHYAQEFLQHSKIQCLLEVPSDLPNKPLKAELRHHLFMVVKEALNNVLKHSGATQAGLMIAFEPETLSVTVVDNGRGLDLNRTERFGNGLRNIRQRAKEIGGEVEFRSKPGQGTWVTLRVVLESAESGESE